MESANSNPPRKMTDSFDAVCKRCGQVAYREQIIGDLQEDGAYRYHRIVAGCFTQDCDPEGVPTGPVIPTCNCQEK